jgi:hypothetical protein
MGGHIKSLLFSSISLEPAGSPRDVVVLSPVNVLACHGLSGVLGDRPFRVRASSDRDRTRRRISSFRTWPASLMNYQLAVRRCEQRTVTPD